MAAACAAALGCASSGDAVVVGGTIIPDAAAPDAAAVDATAVDVGSDGPSLVGDGAAEGGPSCSEQCSADLHQILDCSTPPNILQTCAGNTVCNGVAGDAGLHLQCIDACQTAAANHTSVGCDYYTIPPDAFTYNPELPKNNPGGDQPGSCFAAFVGNTWSAPLKVSLEWKGQSIDATPFSYLPTGTGANIKYTPVPSTGIPANQVAIVFLNQHGPFVYDPTSFKIPCPDSVHAAIETEDIALHGTGIGNALHLMTTLPSVVYDIYPYGGAPSMISSATLLLPTSVWGTNYVAVTAYAPIVNLGLPSEVEIVGTTDGTQVTLLPTNAITSGIPDGGVLGSPAGQPVTYTLDKGQLLQFTQMGDLSGTPIQATQPVGLWGSHWCMNIPNNLGTADAEHEQIPPVEALGSRYAAVSYRTRDSDHTPETVPWRIMGMVKGTTLTYDPPVAGAPASLDVGQLVEFSTSSPFVVTSQDAMHPFYLAGHMTGFSAVTNNPQGLGDPETVNVLPPEQFLSSYLFFTDPTYGETNLVLVRGPASDGKYKDVQLDCLGGAPIVEWTPIGASGLEYTRVDLQAGGFPVGPCDNGLHTITSDSPFGLTVWGWDAYVSYAYPAGGSAKPINTVVVPAQPAQ
jgi:hypothetical protein